ncbi:large-conductance mechanosensitive channel protein MscL [Phenylobacterium sp. J367]|uniref:large-conductance mechanosensitive channel protein MscL n=1 Tax=Phenylobacterium sp. J367 TaxID=2898435 RepID=UPI002150B7D3|nr:large-conductance mechanosensitive channel protein MscL [Phenylobacterium sp. J367]MCR5878343.1 large-conductance mechanosensitive channel protein MscL [Phenylobacterium sp. J367]
MLGEFREFIARGNVIDLAVGVIIGAAFNDIVKTLVDQVVMPPIGLLMSGLDFSHMEWVLKADNPATKVDEFVSVKYGALINAGIKFMIVAWVVFLLVKMINVIRRKDAEEGPKTTPAPAPQEALLMEIRDLLKAQAARTDGAEPPPRP